MRRPVAALGALLLVAGLAVPLFAATSQYIALDVITLANNVSRGSVPGGSAETAVLIVADDEAAFGAASLLGALPLNVPLLVTGADELADSVLDELDRATGRNESATVYAVGAAAAFAGELEAAGYSVIPYDGGNATAVAALAATELFGAPAGTSQRVIVVPAGDEVVTGLASALGIWLGIPVIPVGDGGFTTDAVVRQVWAVGDFPGGLPSISTGGPGEVFTFDAADVFALAIELDALGAGEAGDTGPNTIVTTAPIVVSVTGDTTPALIAATVGARRAVDGDRPPLLLIEGEFDHDFDERCADGGADAASWCQMAAADGDVTFIGLVAQAPDGQVDDDPLPTTGAGLALSGALLLLGAIVVGRRR